MSNGMDVMRGVVQRIGEANKRDSLQRDFDELDLASMQSWTDGELSVWQSRYPADSPQWLWAEQQWRLRLLERQAQAAGLQANKAAIISGVIGVAGALAGVILAWLLGK